MLQSRQVQTMQMDDAGTIEGHCGLVERESILRIDQLLDGLIEAT